MTKMETQTASRSGKISGTRMLKNLRYLQNAAPQIFPGTEPKEGFQSILPFEVLQKLHTPQGVQQVQSDTSLSRLLKGVKLPLAANKVTGPLFKGQFHFVRVQFIIQDQGNNVIAVPEADMATIVQYAILAAQPISVYAGQYGKCRVSVSPAIIEYLVTLPTSSYTRADLEIWVNNIADDPNNGVSSGDCVVILSPDGILNSSVPSNVTGYHSKASVAYIYSRVEGQYLTITDMNLLYAQTLSHEMAETIVDPQANEVNPEVCDACADNCNNLWLSYFDDQSNFIATTRGLPSFGFIYQFYINAIVLPGYGSSCPPQADLEKACNYAFPKIIPVNPVYIEHQQTAAWLIELWLMIHGGDPVESGTRNFKGEINLLSTSRTIIALARCLEDEKTLNAIAEVLAPLTRQIP